MKLDAETTRRLNQRLFGFTEKRMDEIQRFMDELIANDTGTKIDMLKKVLDYSDSPFEAVIIWGWFEAIMAGAKELSN